MQKGMYDNKMAVMRVPMRIIRYSDRQYSEEESNWLEYPLENKHDICISSGYLRILLWDQLCTILKPPISNNTRICK